MQKAQDSSQDAAFPSRPRHRAVLLANQRSGSFGKEESELHALVTYLNEYGWDIDLHFSSSPDDARQRTRGAVEQQMDMLIAVGGDGTINSVIQELAGSETALGVIPSGTFNVWARETGIPLDFAGARDVLINGKLRRIDLGRMQDRYFLLTAGIGLGGTVTYSVKKEKLKRLGPLGYVLTGVRLGLGFDSFRADITIDGRLQTTNALQIVVGNTQLYGSLFKFTWQARCDDGLLDVCIVRRTSKLERIVMMLDFLLQRRECRKWVTYTTCSSIDVNTRKPVNFQIDGEPIGLTPATFTIVPASLKVVVPLEPPEGLFPTISKRGSGPIEVGSTHTATH
jgi:diacylglycerol kinase (ATP)